MRMRHDLALGEVAHLVADRFQRLVEPGVADGRAVMLAHQRRRAARGSPRCCRSRSAPRPPASRARRPAPGASPRSARRTISPWLIGMPPRICARYSPIPMRTSSSSSLAEAARRGHPLRIGARAGASPRRRSRARRARGRRAARGRAAWRRSGHPRDARARPPRSRRPAARRRPRPPRAPGRAGRLRLRGGLRRAAIETSCGCGLTALQHESACDAQDGARIRRMRNDGPALKQIHGPRNCNDFTQILSGFLTIPGLHGCQNFASCDACRSAPCSVTTWHRSVGAHAPDRVCRSFPSSASPPSASPIVSSERDGGERPSPACSSPRAWPTRAACSRIRSPRCRSSRKDYVAQPQPSWSSRFADAHEAAIDSAQDRPGTRRRRRASRLSSRLQGRVANLKKHVRGADRRAGQSRPDRVRRRAGQPARQRQRDGAHRQRGHVVAVRGRPAQDPHHR